MSELNEKACVSFINDFHSIMESVPKRKLEKADDLEMVFIDNINGKLKHRTAGTLIEIYQCLRDGGKPVGVLLLNYSNHEDIIVREFPNLSQEEKGLAIYAFAEAQDDFKEMNEEHDE